MSRNKLELIIFGLVLLGFVVFVKTGSALLFSLGIVSAAFLIFSKNKFIKQMTGEKIELIFVFGVILIAPIIYHIYLLKYKKVAREIVFKDIKIYLFLYALIAMTSLLLFFK